MKIQVAPHIESLVPYPPGKPLEELERELGITGSIKLASNENAWGPSPKAMTAISAALTNLHRYPDGSCYYLTQRLAEILGVLPEEIVCGNGSNEIIELLAAAFIEPGDEVISSHPSFLMYQKLVQVRGGVNRVIPLRDMNHDLDGILGALSDKTRLIFMDIPNNPCGTVIDKLTLDNFLDRVPENIIVVLDEAYVDFVHPDLRLDVTAYLRPAKSAGGLSKPPIVALRTFSKAYGLAGLRLGYGLMPAKIAGYLHRVRQPFNVNSLAQVGALAALDDADHYQKTMEKTRAGKAWLVDEIGKLGCRSFPSQTNFFLIDVGCDASGLYERMLYKGVIIRPMQAYGFPDYIRITVGLPEENQRFIRAFAETLTK